MSILLKVAYWNHSNYGRRFEESALNNLWNYVGQGQITVKPWVSRRDKLRAIILKHRQTRRNSAKLENFFVKKSFFDENFSHYHPDFQRNVCLFEVSA